MRKTHSLRDSKDKSMKKKKLIFRDVESMMRNKNQCGKYNNENYSGNIENTCVWYGREILRSVFCTNLRNSEAGNAFTKQRTLLCFPALPQPIKKMTEFLTDRPISRPHHPSIYPSVCAVHDGWRLDVFAAALRLDSSRFGIEPGG